MNNTEHKLLSRYRTDVYSDGTILQRHEYSSPASDEISIDTNIKLLSRYETNVYEDGTLEEVQVPLFSTNKVERYINLSGLDQDCVCQLFVLRNSILQFQSYLSLRMNTPDKKFDLIESTNTSIKRTASGLNLRIADVYEAVTVNLTGYIETAVDFDLFCSSLQLFLLCNICSDYIQGSTSQIEQFISQAIKTKLGTQSAEYQAVKDFFKDPTVRLRYTDNNTQYSC